LRSEKKIYKEVKSMAKVKWNYSMRNQLQLLLEEGFTLRRIADSFGVSYPTLKKSLRKKDILNIL